MKFLTNQFFNQHAAKFVPVFLIVIMTITSHCNCTEKDCCFWRQENLDTESGNVELNWVVDSFKRIITFEIVSDSDIVSFGFTHDGNLSKPFDFVLGGLDESDNKMLLDMTAHFRKDNIEFVNDTEQDYHLLDVQRIGSSVKIKFYRRWDTGDSNDLQFDLSLVHLIWFNGIMDKRSVFPNEIGRIETTVNFFEIYILDPKVNHQDRNAESWQFNQRGLVLSNKSTTYWCTLHKTPRSLRDKHHVIGFRALLNTKSDRKHTHHIVLYKCDASSINESKLEAFVITNGNDCSESWVGETGRLPIQKCRTFMYVWAYGGEDFFFPNDVGYPIGEKETEYFLLEVHYDNAKLISDLKVNVGVEVILTKEIRKNDAGLFMVGYDISPSLILPSRKEDIVITGHCKASCTNDLLPSDGIHVFGVLLHSHKLGRKMKLIQRGTNELNEAAQEILYDDFYEYSFQQSRLLSERKRISPGDILSMECHYSSKQRNATTLGGFSSSDEMCLGFLWYYPNVRNLKACVSEISLPDIMTRLEINNNISEVMLKKWPLDSSILKNVLDKEVYDVDVWNKIVQLHESYEDHIAWC